MIVRTFRTALLLLVASAGVLRAPVLHAQTTLEVADQKEMVKALLQAAGVLNGAPYTIHWTDFEAASPLLQAMGAGAVDTGVAGDGPFLFAWGAGLPIKAAYLLPPRVGGASVAVVVGASSPIHDVAALSGKRIATGRGSIGHLLLLRLIQTGRIPAPAPQLVFLTPAQAKAALDAGSIDAWSSWEPYVSLETIASHGHVVVDGGSLLTGNGFFVATDAALAGKQAELADFYRRVDKGFEWGRAHPQQYAEIFAHQTGLPLAVAQAVATKMIATPAPLDDKVIQQEQVTLDAYRAGGVLNPPGKLVTAFALPAAAH